MCLGKVSGGLRDESSRPCWDIMSPGEVYRCEARESNSTLRELLWSAGVGVRLARVWRRPLSLEVDLEMSPSSGGASVRSGAYMLL